MATCHAAVRETAAPSAITSKHTSQSRSVNKY